MRITAATRGSALARTQVDLVRRAIGVGVDPHVVTTLGDQRLSTPIHELGGQGVFVKGVQEAVLRGEADIAVHSAKDLTSESHPALVIAAVLPRGDPRDALVGSDLSSLPHNALVGTGSVRRRAQLAALRPDLRFAELRGNIHTRLSRVGTFDAIVMAQVALDRLGVQHRGGEVFETGVLIPQVGQGAIVVEARRDRPDLVRLLEAIDDPESRRTLDTERAFLSMIGEGCTLPIGGHAIVDGDELVLTGVISTADGAMLLRGVGRGSDHRVVGETLAARLLSLMSNDPATGLGRTLPGFV